MPSARGNWCEVGAATRVAKYREWIADSIEYLEGKPLEAEAEDERMERDEASTISAYMLSLLLGRHNSLRSRI